METMEKTGGDDATPMTPDVPPCRVSCSLSYGGAYANVSLVSPTVYLTIYRSLPGRPAGVSK